MAGLTTAAFLSQPSFRGRTAATESGTSPGLLMAAAPVGFRETKMLVGGQSVPLSVTSLTLSPILTSGARQKPFLCGTATLITTSQPLTSLGKDLNPSATLFWADVVPHGHVERRRPRKVEAPLWPLLHSAFSLL